MTGYVLSAFAEDDLRGIHRYTIRKHGIEQFQTYRAYINKAFRELVEDPFRLGTKDRKDLRTGCRFYRVQHHYIAYRVSDEVVQVGRVLHEAMNFEDHLSEEVFE